MVYDELGDGHQLVEQKGRGGQGEVWSLPGGQAAVKVLTAPRSGDAERLRLRLAAVRRFDLSGVPIARPIRLLGGDRVGYLMELLEDMVAIGSLVAPPAGESGEEWYHGSGGLRRRLRLLTLAAEALHRLHTRALAYCDISPTNVLVSKSAKHEQVWLIDPDNLIVARSAAEDGVYTPGYGAPEVVTEREGCSTLTDAFSFAVLAFQMLVHAHPFVGELAYEDPNLLDQAYAGRLPWIDHPTDDRNRASRGGLNRERALTRGLASLARQAFEDGLNDPLARPSLADWRTKLDQAALSTITCPACRGTYYARAATCPRCHAGRPDVARADLHVYVPSQPGLPELAGARESDRIESVLLTAAEPVVIRARNALVCLDRGPDALPVDPDEPVAEVSWDGDATVMVRTLGGHGVWLADPSMEQVIQVRLGERQRLPGPWSVRFGRPAEVHRFFRFSRQRVS